MSQIRIKRAPGSILFRDYHHPPQRPAQRPLFITSLIQPPNCLCHRHRRRPCSALLSVTRPELGNSTSTGTYTVIAEYGTQSAEELLSLNVSEIVRLLSYFSSSALLTSSPSFFFFGRRLHARYTTTKPQLLAVHGAQIVSMNIRAIVDQSLRPFPFTTDDLDNDVTLCLTVRPTFNNHSLIRCLIYSTTLRIRRTGHSRPSSHPHIAAEGTPEHRTVQLRRQSVCVGGAVRRAETAKSCVSSPSLSTIGWIQIAPMYMSHLLDTYASSFRFRQPKRFPRVIGHLFI